MKIRNGFVSNSSSSSFLISLMEPLGDRKRLITKREEELLLKNGFRYVQACLLSHIDKLDCQEFFDRTSKTYDEDIHWALCRSVSCNQDDVISFLLENDISFAASIHYRNSNMFYQKGDNHVLSMPNYGEEYAMYHFHDNKHDKDFPEEDDLQKKEKINKKEWLEEHYED